MTSLKPLKPKKRLGQHFLNNPLTISRIVHLSTLKPEDKVLEIGPGQGAITTQILSIVKEMDVVEYDSDLIAPLKAYCEPLGKLHIHQTDILKFDLQQLKNLQCQAPEQTENKNKNNNKLKIIGNLPYNISTPILFHLIQYLPYIHNMHFMLQKEVVDRICAKPNSKAYGRLTVMLQASLQAEALMIIPPTDFDPPPKVNSQIVRLTPYVPNLNKQSSISILNPVFFGIIVRDAFNQRRKTIQNSLKNQMLASDWNKINIDPMQRAENLTVTDYIEISNHLTLNHKK